MQEYATMADLAKIKMLGYEKRCGEGARSVRAEPLNRKKLDPGRTPNTPGKLEHPRKRTFRSRPKPQIP
jgi:hypothetical protein